MEETMSLSMSRSQYNNVLNETEQKCKWLLGNNGGKKERKKGYRVDAEK